MRLCSAISRGTVIIMAGGLAISRKSAFLLNGKIGHHRRKNTKSAILIKQEIILTVGLRGCWLPHTIAESVNLSTLSLTVSKSHVGYVSSQAL